MKVIEKISKITGMIRKKPLVVQLPIKVTHSELIPALRATDACENDLRGRRKSIPM